MRRSVRQPSTPGLAPKVPAAVPFARSVAGGVVLALKVQPRASRTELAGVLGDALRVRIAAPPVDSAANLALIQFLADTLGVGRNRLTILRGGGSRQKQVLVQGTTLGAVLAALGVAGAPSG